MTAAMGSRSSEIRIIASGVIFRYKTSRQEIITHDRVEVSHSSQEETGNDNMC